MYDSAKVSKGAVVVSVHIYFLQWNLCVVVKDMQAVFEWSAYLDNALDCS